MATLHNRVFAQSATADELLDVQEGLLQTFTRIFSLPVPIERVVFVDLIPLSENNFDMAPQTEALENLLGLGYVGGIGGHGFQQQNRVI